MPSAEKILGIKRSSIYDKLKTDPLFPQMIPIGTGDRVRAMGFIESELYEYVNLLIAISRGLLNELLPLTSNEYERVREEKAKIIEIRTATLDKAVNIERERLKKRAA